MNILHIVKFELSQILRLRTVLIMLLVLPLLLIFILGTALSGEFKAEDSPIKTVKLALFHADQGSLKESVEQFFNSKGTQKYIEPIIVDSEEAVQSLLRESKAQYGVVIPSDFSAKVFQGESAAWRLFPGKNSSDNMTAESMIQLFIQQVNDIQATVIVLGPQAIHLESMGASSSESSFAPTDNNSRIHIGTLLSSHHPSSAIQYYSAAYLIMFLLYSGMSAAISILSDKENGTLLRLYSLPVSPAQILLGKLLGNSVFAMMQAAIIIGVTKWIFGVEWGDQWLYLIVICLLTIIAAMSLGFIFAMWFQTSKAVESIYSMLVIVMTFLSGGMIANLGETIQNIGKFTINHWAANGVLRLMVDSSSEMALHSIQTLGYIALGLLLIATFSSRRAKVHE